MDTWFGANMCSPLGSVLRKLSTNGVAFEFISVKEDIERILRKNEFFEAFGYPKLEDSNQTTIRYLELKPNQDGEFLTYIKTELLQRPELPYMSDLLKKKMTESIFEIFQNAKIHSKSEHIVTCGQFFPKKNTIEFSVSDIGMGIQQNVSEFFQKGIPATSAIEWAILPGNTTKRGTPGGHGFAILREFTEKNKGKINIVSDRGFYEFIDGQDIFKEIPCPFPGTTINMRFQTDDSASYYLLEELKAADIF
ncbi:hypothetical protein [Leptospira sp. 'Mane']|uniref:hypothetical protein n=1 Tax=Leptospira sp. 'Mane' TaxID=3387407 RepID=UPI00398B093E